MINFNRLQLENRTKFNIIFTELYYFWNVIGQAVDQLQIRSQNGSTLLSRWTDVIGQ